MNKHHMLAGYFEAQGKLKVAQEVLSSIETDPNVEKYEEVGAYWYEAEKLAKANIKRFEDVLESEYKRELEIKASINLGNNHDL